MQRCLGLGLARTGERAAAPKAGSGGHPVLSALLDPIPLPLHVLLLVDTRTERTSLGKPWLAPCFLLLPLLVAPKHHPSLQQECGSWAKDRQGPVSPTQDLFIPPSQGPLSLGSREPGVDVRTSEVGNNFNKSLFELKLVTVVRKQDVRYARD